MKQKKKGIALVSVLLILTALMVMTMGFAAFTTTDHAISQAYYSSTITFYLSQAGLEYFHHLLKHNMLVFPAVINPPTLNYYTPYTQVGQCVNVYHADGDESLVISSLVWENLGELFHTDRYIGTFNIQATEMQDDNAPANTNQRVLYVTSVGMVKELPTGVTQADLDVPNPTFDFENNATIKARRTLIMRVPYSQFSHMRYRFNSGANQIYYKVLNDAWYERYR